MQSISQWQTKKQRNYKKRFMPSLNLPKNNVALMLLKKCCCNKSIDNVVMTYKRNITITKRNET